MIRWSSHELESELDLSGDDPQRREALMAHADRMRRLHGLTQRLPQSDPEQPAKADLARVHRQAAERKLADFQAGVDRKRDGDPPLAAAVPPHVEIKEDTPAPKGTARFDGGEGSADPVRDARVEIGTLAPKVAARDKMPSTRVILAKLEEKVSMSFANETPLEDVLRYIKSTTQGPTDNGIPIYVDPVGLNEAEKSMTSPVTLDLEGVPLKTTLRLLLKQLGLAYCVKEGMLMIGTPEGILKELEEAEKTAGADDAPVAAAVEPPQARPTPPVAAGRPEAGADPLSSEKLAEVLTPSANLTDSVLEPPKPDPGTLKTRAIWKALDKPAKLAITRGTPLSEVLKTLKTSVKAIDGGELQIFVDPAVAHSLEREIEFDLEGIPLRTSLSLLLSQVGLNWGLQDGVLIVSTTQGLTNYQRIAAHFSHEFNIHDQLAPSFELSPEFLAKFDAPITLSFPEETPLEEVLKAIRAATKGPGDSGIPVFYGPPVTIWDRPDPEKIGRLPTRIDVKDVPLRTCLALLLASQGPGKDLGQGMGASPPVLDGRLLEGLLVVGPANWVQSLSIPQGGFGPGMGPVQGMGGGQGMM